MGVHADRGMEGDIHNSGSTTDRYVASQITFKLSLIIKVDTQILHAVIADYKFVLY